ncbi:coiled-coil domain-containing protein 28B isoform X3 [Drosophila sulfurigaster albostrigata]|uniref:Coiled-coil domain-containing protein 28B isoform X3 n=1 Tax=Drosophila albomicans TaxID=7291 RepID=A0A9C6SLT5_DROAB|nr:coiled-coil domain-containing protein 28B isoform X3 [Drosophila albomicans]XP_060658873.1 coiled-coil domain-containing protein 28B isoform X3 [Drosophila nasuta]XP_062134381.1 coiled-coil domain-containing protein 28B isoform X3 [Drosophila sulfurigaster albostrigata]
MEPNDEVVERQKLVPNDVETEEEAKSAQTPATPVAVPKINIKGISSGETTRSRNSASCSIERTISEKGQGAGSSQQGQQASAKTTLQYVNERRPRPHAQSSAAGGGGDERFEFKTRPRKLLKVPDVKHMERALLGLLDDFHSGKLKAFGSGCTMDQMTKIREQQESLAKLHFELAAAEEDSLEHGNEFNTSRAQENMLQLMQRLEQLSISIEQLQTSHTGL